MYRSCFPILSNRCVVVVLFVDNPPSLCCQGAVQVKLELGHRAQLRKTPTVEGFTHDWMVFVRGPEQSDIQHFVEKVVFHLHESFPKPKRGERRRCRGCERTPLIWVFCKDEAEAPPGGLLAAELQSPEHQAQSGVLKAELRPLTAVHHELVQSPHH